MDSQLPPPKNVSDEFFEQTRPEINLIDLELATFEGLVDEERNIALVQWSQFIEHDLVKTVFQTMSEIKTCFFYDNYFNLRFIANQLKGNGNPIECCAEDATNAPPRYRHPACAPLNVQVSGDDYSRLPSCLNYVRSALGVTEDCKFGPAQQVFQIDIHLRRLAIKLYINY